MQLSGVQRFTAIFANLMTRSEGIAFSEERYSGISLGRQEKEGHNIRINQGCNVSKARIDCSHPTESLEFGLLMGGSRIRDERDKRGHAAKPKSTNSKPRGSARGKTGSGLESKFDKMRNAFFPARPLIRPNIRPRPADNMPAGLFSVFH